MSSPIMMWQNQHRRDPGAKVAIKRLQAALELGADGLYGKGTAAAVSDWQEENGYDPTGWVDAEMCEALGVKCTYVEKRVRVARYGSLPRNSDMLVEVPSSREGRTMKLHVLAAAGMRSMGEAVKADLGIDLALASAWRPHRWKSRSHYEEEMVKRYGSVSKGRKYMAYASPHETGLAMDIGVGGLEPRSATIDKQKKTDIYAWLLDNAWRFGWHPYKREPWHWEFPLGYRSWESGTAGADMWQPQKGVHFAAEDEDEYVETPFDDEWVTAAEPG